MAKESAAKIEELQKQLATRSDVQAVGKQVTNMQCAIAEHEREQFARLTEIEKKLARIEARQERNGK